MHDAIIIPTISSHKTVLCDGGFLSTLATVEDRIATLKITDAESAQTAADLQQRLTTAGRKLEAARTELKAPFLAKGKEIDEAAKGPAQRIEGAKRRLAEVLTAYAEAQAKAAREAEAARQKELARLEEVRRKEEADAKAKADAIAAKNKVEVMDFDDGPTATEAAIATVAAAPIVAERPSGVSFKKTMRIASVDPDKLPEKFVVKQADTMLLRTTFCTAWKDGDPMPLCVGVVFAIDKQVISTGRSTF